MGQRTGGGREGRLASRRGTRAPAAPAHVGPGPDQPWQGDHRQGEDGGDCCQPLQGVGSPPPAPSTACGQRQADAVLKAPAR